MFCLYLKVFMFKVSNRRNELVLVSMGQGHPRCHRISNQPHIFFFDCYLIISHICTEFIIKYVQLGFVDNTMT